MTSLDGGLALLVLRSLNGAGQGHSQTLNLRMAPIRNQELALV
jgi:hypothetical protein